MDCVLAYMALATIVLIYTLPVIGAAFFAYTESKKEDAVKSSIDSMESRIKDLEDARKN